MQANLLAARTPDSCAVNQVYNVAVGARTSLNQLFSAIRDLVSQHFPHVRGAHAAYREFRPGDVRYSQADIERIATSLAYIPTHTLMDGVREAMPWYVERLAR